MSRVAVTSMIGLTSLGVGSATETSTLVALGAALLLLVAYAAVLVLAASRSVTIDRRVHATEVVEGEPLEMTICLGVRHPLGLLCELAMSGVPPAQLRASTNRVMITFGRRGRLVLEPATVRLRDPLGFFASDRRAGESVPVLVLPRGQEGPRPARFRAPPRESEPMDPDGLRAYRAGTPASRVHWASLARGAGLQERRLSDERVETPLYVVDMTAVADDIEADRIVRSAVAHVLRCARAGGCAILLPGDETPAWIGPNLLGWPDVHRRLAVLGTAD
jgi:uncharacterized protein (DUF58 family)